MVRPPPSCDDKVVRVKKGPWTPEEDIILVSYVQQHGAGNWRSIPTNTGLLRCSKSCRLRWTNYLRPGIKRGNFTDQEENLIIRLQALLGNRWAVIASYLPERTDNDIKNYWNVHLKKKVRKIQMKELDVAGNVGDEQFIARGQWERRLQEDMNWAKQALVDALSMAKQTSSSYQTSSGPFDVDFNSSSSGTNYASSTENISRLLDGWMKKESRSESGHSNRESICKFGTSTDSTQSSSDASEGVTTDDQSATVDRTISPVEASELGLLLEDGTLDYSWLFDEFGGVYDLEQYKPTYDDNDDVWLEFFRFRY